MLEGDSVRNAFDVHLVNKHRARVIFAFEPDTAHGERFFLPLRAVTLEPLAGRDVPVFASLPIARYRAGATVRIRDVPQGLPRAEARTFEAPFLGPQ